MVVGIGVIAGIECVIMGNDPTVLGRRAHALRRQEVDAGHRDRPRQPHALRQLRGVGRRRPAHGRRRRRRPQDPDHPLRRDRPLLLRDDRAVQAAHPHGVRRVRLLHRRRRLPARPVRLHDRRQGAVEGLPRRPAAGEDGHRRGQRRRDARRRRSCTPRCPASATTSPRTRWTPSACAARSCRTSTGARPGPSPRWRPTTPVHDPEELLGLVSRDLRQPGRRARRDRPRGRRLPLRGVQGPLRHRPWSAAGRRSTATRSGILGNNGVHLPRRRRRRPPTSSSSATRSTCRWCSCRTSPASWSAGTSRPTGSSRRARR